MNVHSLIEELAQYTLPDKGMHRLTYTPDWLESRKVIRKEMENIGMTTWEDGAGNLFGRLPGSDPEALPVATGSHLDTVPHGGKYDGILGVVGGLAAIAEIQKSGPTKHPLELIIFAAEEASRFGSGMMGSKLLLGMGDLDKWLATPDTSGMPLENVLKNSGLEPQKLKEPIKNQWHAFLELHIEQGPVLERENLDIGVVEAIAGPTSFKVTVKGLAGHSGATPMPGRKDAMVTAARMIIAAKEIGLARSHQSIVTTVGNVWVYPGAVNVIPGQVDFLLDVRGIQKEIIWETIDEIKATFEKIAQEEQGTVEINLMTTDDPTPLSPEIVSLLSELAQEENLSYKVMPSGAGHDAMNMVTATPTGMIFIPCLGGISHNPDEYSSPEQIDKGILLLTKALKKLAE